MVAGCAAFGCHSNADLHARGSDPGRIDGPSHAAERPSIDASSRDARTAGAFDPTRGSPAATWSSEWTAIFLDEAIAKRDSNVDSFPDRDLHLVFEEWFDTGHVRVSVRGDGWYAIELDGPIRWSGPRYRPGRGWRRPPTRDFYSGARGGFPILHHFGDFGTSYYMMRNLSAQPPLPAFPPCPAGGDDGAGPYHAELTLSLEHVSPWMLHSWWTSTECAGFPHAIARDAWNLIERVAGGWVSRPPWYPPSPTLPPRPDHAPDCRGFGGRIHGASRCFRVALKAGRSGPISRRVMGPGAVSLVCDSTTNVGGHAVTLKCDQGSTADHTRRAVISLLVDGGRPIAVDEHEGGWDFIHGWIRPDGDAMDLTIDYGVDD
jgi:hypothetical protein